MAAIAVLSAATMRARPLKSAKAAKIACQPGSGVI
jgi:hypothetical protein